MKIFTLTLSLSLLVLSAFCQGKEKLYDPDADANQQITEAVRQAKAEGKHIFVQFGGNWCSWCYLFHNFCKKDREISQLIAENYVSIKVNYDSKHKNEDILSRFKYPQRFGFPVFIILDGDGNYLHTQNSVYLEEGKSYNRDRVIEFLNQWSPLALNPLTYQE